MSRRRGRARGPRLSMWLRLFVVVILGAGLVATGGWTPVFVAALLVLTLLTLVALRPPHRRRRR